MIDPYLLFISKLSGSYNWPLQVHENPNFSFSDFLSSFDHFYENFVFFVLNDAHIYSEYVAAFLNHFANRFLLSI